MSANFEGKVISVLDGDTIEVLHEKKTERIRLYGIDCPEKSQAFGQKAKHATSALIFGKDLRIETLVQQGPGVAAMGVDANE